MIGWIALRLVGAGVGERWARLVAWVLIAVLVAGLIRGAIAVHDAVLIDTHDAKQELKARRDQDTRTVKADAGELGRRATDDKQHDQLEGAITNATLAQPEAARTGAGPATNAALDELRRRQAAKRVK